MASKKILIFSLTYYPLVGGAEVAVKEITDRLLEYEFDMVTMRLDATHKPFERMGNVNVYRVGSGSSYINKIFFVPRAAWKAWRLGKDKRYAKYWAIMTNMTFPISLLRLFGNKTPYIITLQDGDPFEHVFKRLRIRIFKPLLTRGFRNASVIQTISHFLAGWARKVGYKGRVEVVPNGVDTKKFEGQRIEHEDTVLITTSRLVEKNGIRYVISALKLLPENVKFHILGSGPLMSELNKQVREEKLLGRVKFVGFVDMKEIPNHLHTADIFIRPSLSEGMGNSFIEAMAAGLPVLATPVGGIPDFLFDPDKTPEHPPTGLFVEVENPESIAKQVTRLMNNENLRDTLVGNAKRMVREKYDWDLIAETMKRRVFEA
ncbi:glycosyltransferase family 4 protein [Candidatus Parcubacteria bacterium]|nr:glycosyltransferase family 4 protein [Candidatus Parcubacteria bacterium]